MFTISKNKCNLFVYVDFTPCKFAEFICSDIIVESFGFSTYKVMQIEIILHVRFQFQCLLFLFLV